MNEDTVTNSYERGDICNWKSILPHAYHWLDFVNLRNSDAATEANCFVVAVKNETKEHGLEIDALGIDPLQKSALNEVVSRIGLPGNGTVRSVYLEDRVFFLVPLLKGRYSKQQIGRQLGLDAAKAVIGVTTEKLHIYSASAASAGEILEGFIAGMYGGGLFRNNEGTPLFKTLNSLKSISTFEPLLDDSEFDQLRYRSQALILTRTLQDAPPNWLTPEMLASIAADIANQFDLEFKITEVEELRAMGMGAFLSVAAGSLLPPFMVTIVIPGKDNSKSVCLVGKGLTFDTGGLSIKPALAMDEMKYDMSGAATVVGAAHYFGRERPDVRTVCIIGACENMPSGTAIKPGSIVKAMNGKTIEVLNTDAEGRLVLADLLNYAVKEFRPDLVIDVATLTGAVLHALGHVGSAVMSNDDRVADLILKKSASCGELMCRLPLWGEFEREIKSDNADFANIASPSVLAGSIIGGTFLRQFVAGTPWAHIDIAGTAWNCKGSGFPISGGSGFGLRTLLAVCTSMDMKPDGTH